MIWAFADRGSDEHRLLGAISQVERKTFGHCAIE
jgi:hypothetical protein